MFTGVANAIVIDFEAGAGTDLPYAEDGFNVVSGSPANRIFPAIEPDVNTFGSASLGWCSSGCGGIQTISVTKNGGGAFDFISINAANLDTGVMAAGNTLEVEGLLQGGGSVFQSFPLVQDVQSLFMLAGTFTNLVEIRLSSGLILGEEDFTNDLIIDNINLDTGAAAVPAPGALLLLGSGLIGLMRVRKNKLVS